MNDAFRQAVMVGLVNVLMTFVAIWLIDRLGRKPLLIMGIAGHGAVFVRDQLGVQPGKLQCHALVLIAIIGFVASFAILARAGNVGAALGNISQRTDAPRPFRWQDSGTPWSSATCHNDLSLGALQRWARAAPFWHSGCSPRRRCCSWCCSCRKPKAARSSSWRAT